MSDLFGIVFRSLTQREKKTQKELLGSKAKVPMLARKCLPTVGTEARRPHVTLGQEVAASHCMQPFGLRVSGPPLLGHQTLCKHPTCASAKHELARPLLRESHREIGKRATLDRGDGRKGNGRRGDRWGAFILWQRANIFLLRK